MEFILSIFTEEFFYAVIRMASPIILAALGEVLLERAGIFNLGIEGTMLFGSFFAVLGSFISGNGWIGVAFAAAIGALVGLVYGGAVVSIRANQAVTGTGINILAVGLTALMSRMIWGVMEVPLSVTGIGPVKIPILGDIPLIGSILFNHSPLVYIAFILIGVVSFIIYKTSWGLKISSIGEVPKAADTMGINVIGWKYGMCIISSMMAAVSGAILSLSFMNCFVDNMSGGRGYMAVACVILGQLTPLGIALGGLLIFGAGNALQMRMQAFGMPISSNLLLVFPMIFALVVVLIVRGSASARPFALAKPYFKE